MRANTMIQGSVAVAVAVMLAACVAPPRAPSRFKIAAPFDREAAAQAIKEGPHSISGSAFLRQRGGGVVTCAGADVFLIPATDYATARMAYIYPSTSGGIAEWPAAQMGFEPDYPEYVQLRRATKCDARGDFSFDAVSDGDFYVVTYVLWQVANNTNGGALMQRVSVRGKSVRSLTLTQ